MAKKTAVEMMSDDPLADESVAQIKVGSGDAGAGTASSTEVQVASGQQAPAYLIEAAERNEGAGVSEDPNDNIIPLIYVLQSNSPQVDEQSPAYIPGARPGHIWMKNCAVVPGEVGILFQPCHFSKDWPEWVPRERGGGLVRIVQNKVATEEDARRYGREVEVGEDIPDLPTAKFKVDEKNRQKRWFNSETNNDLVLTRRHAGYAIISPGVEIPFVIPMKGASHAVSKTWMYTMNGKRSPKGKRYPSYGFIYRMTTKQKSNPLGKWHQFEIAEAGWASDEQVLRGERLYEAIMSGEQRFEEEGLPDVIDAEANKAF